MNYFQGNAAPSCPASSSDPGGERESQFRTARAGGRGFHGLATVENGVVDEMVFARQESVGDRLNGLTVSANRSDYP